MTLGGWILHFAYRWWICAMNIHLLSVLNIGMLHMDSRHLLEQNVVIVFVSAVGGCSLGHHRD